MIKSILSGKKNSLIGIRKDPILKEKSLEWMLVS